MLHIYIWKKININACLLTKKIYSTLLILMMLLQSKLVTGILAGPNLYPGTPGLTLNQSWELGQIMAHTEQEKGIRAGHNPLLLARVQTDERDWVCTCLRAW